MLITYRRTTGGLFAVLALAAVAAVATVLTLAVAAILVAVTAVVSPVLILGRAVLPRSRRHHAVAPKTLWPSETIDTTAVTALDCSDTTNLPPIDDGRR
jgi:hypothetical protein